MDEVGIYCFHDFDGRGCNAGTSCNEDSVLSVEGKLFLGEDIKVHFVVYGVVDGFYDDSKEDYIKDKL